MRGQEAQAIVADAAAPAAMIRVLGQNPMARVFSAHEIYTVMKLIYLLVGLLALFGATACEEEHEHMNRGGAYDNYNRGWGHDRDRDRDNNYYNGNPYRY